MIHILLATHGGLGKALLETAAIVSGGADGIHAIGLYPGGGAEDVEASLRQALCALPAGDDLLCLVDIPGGSPARVAAALALECGALHVLSGVNLGMLTEALLLKDCMDVIALKRHIMEAAAATVMDLGERLREQVG